MSKFMTKQKALNIHLNSLFVNSGGTLTRMKFDKGKYKWLGSQKEHIKQFQSSENAKSIEDNPWIKVIYFERCKDKNGVYCQVMCIVDEIKKEVSTQ